MKTMPMKEAQNLLQEKNDVVLIDVRTEEEYKEGHIPGSLLIPLDQASNICTIVPDKNKTLFVYCLSGGRSKNACGIFQKLGYVDVTDIGGIASYSGELER